MSNKMNPPTMNSLPDSVTIEKKDTSSLPQDAIENQAEETGGFASSTNWLELMEEDTQEVSDVDVEDEDVEDESSKEIGESSDVTRKEEYKLKREEKIPASTLDGQADAIVGLLDRLPKFAGLFINNTWDESLSMDSDLRKMMKDCSLPFIAKHRDYFSDERMLFAAGIAYFTWLGVVIYQMMSEKRERKRKEREDLRREIRLQRSFSSSHKPVKKIKRGEGLESVEGVKELLKKRSNFQIDTKCRYIRPNYEMPAAEFTANIIPKAKRVGQWLECPGQSEAELLLVLRDTQYLGAAKKAGKVGANIPYITKAYVAKYGVDATDFSEQLTRLEEKRKALEGDA